MRRTGGGFRAAWRGGVLAWAVAWSSMGVCGTAAAAKRVAVVGCAAEGMSGPAPPPSPLPAGPVLAGTAARKLVLYAAPGLAVLAPRGWHCLEFYGSGGASLMVTPGPLHTPPDEGTVTGPAVELAFLSGENSGREQVAAVLARLFPARQRFVRGVEDGEADDSGRVRRFPRGPGPADRIVRRDRRTVEYGTAPGRAGLGTFAGILGPGRRRVEGVAMLAAANGVDSVVLLHVRLPAEMAGLTRGVVAVAERDRR